MIGVQSSGNILVGPSGLTTGSNAAATATMSDTLTFQIPGANSATVTSIGVSFQLFGASTLLAYQPSANLTVQMQFGTGSVWWQSFSPSNPQLVSNLGWLSSAVVSQSANNFSFTGQLAVTGPNPTVNLAIELALACQNAACDFSHGEAWSLCNLPHPV